MMKKVYLISADIDDMTLYKIGFTKRDINDRINEFKTGNASDFNIINQFKSKWASKIETQLHKYYNKSKIKREWFSLSENDINDFIPMCEKIHNNLELIKNNNTYYLDRGDF